MSRCQALINSGRRPCRAHAARNGSGRFCQFHELTHEQEQRRRAASPEGARLARFVAGFGNFDEAFRCSRIPETENQIIVTAPLLELAENFLESWLDWPEFNALSAQMLLPPPPEDGQEYLEGLREIAADIIESDPTLGNA